MSMSRIPENIKQLSSDASTESGWRLNICTACGWVGKRIGNYNDYQLTLLKEEAHAHRCAAYIEEQK
jgi:hypothetical protein